MSHTPQSAKGFMVSEDVDGLARMMMAMLSELWIARDRIAILESLLEEVGVLSAGAADHAAPSPELAERLEAMRSIMVANVLGATRTGERISMQELREAGAIWRRAASVAASE
jgi:hypothetical protein